MDRHGWPTYYILSGHLPLAVDVMTFGKWLMNNRSERTVGNTVIEKGVSVSTVFLGLDHRHFGDGDPLLFETMVFGGPMDGEMWRYSTWEDAERGHDSVVVEASKAAARLRAIKRDAGAD